MKKLILLLLLILTINIVEASKIYFLELNYDNGLLTIKDKKLLNGYYPDRNTQPNEGYRLEVASFSNEIIYSFNFEPPLTVYTDASDENGTLSGYVVKLKQKDFTITLPYSEDAKEINIYDKTGEILSIDVREFNRKPKIIGIIMAVIILALILTLFLLLKRK